MSGLGCDRTHGRSGSAQIETNKFQSTLPEGSDRRYQRIRGASLRRRVERPHHDTSLGFVFMGEKMPWGLIPYVQALLLARAIRGDIDAYQPFMWK